MLSADAPVANYDDGLYETFAVAAGRSSLDLERVEILRGPQGTLSGRNALGGAINEVTAKPTSTPYAEARVTYGNYDHVNLEAVASGPLNDNWAVRVYGNWEKQTEGWIQNVVPGEPSEGNVINEWYVDAQIQGKINPTTSTCGPRFKAPSVFNGGVRLRRGVGRLAPTRCDRPMST